MKKFLILVFTILIGLGLINKLYNNPPMYEEGAIEEYLTYLEENLPTYVPKLLDNSFHEGVFEYANEVYTGTRPFQEEKVYIELTTGTVITGKIRDLNDDLSSTTYDFYEIQSTYKWYHPFKKINPGYTAYVLKTEWENPELDEVTIFKGGPGTDTLINLVRMVVRYAMAFAITPIYIVHSVAIILWGLISL